MTVLKEMKKIIFVVEKTSDGYSAYSKDWEKMPVGTIGDNYQDLRKNLVDAIDTYYDAYGINKKASLGDFELQMDLAQFFDFYKVINASDLGERIGMNKSLLYQYVNGQKTPSNKQVNKILSGIKELGKELSAIDFV